MSEEIKDSKVSKDLARRKILRTIVAGGGVVTAAKVAPETWVKPAIESVVLPSHAQTSAPGPVPPGGDFTSGTITAMEQVTPDELLAEEPLSDELLEFFMPSAQAGGCFNGTCNVDFGLAVDTANSEARVCVSGDTQGQSQMTYIDATTLGPAINSVGDFSVLSGTFSGGQWTLNVRKGTVTNAATEVTLSPGAVNCFLTMS